MYTDNREKIEMYHFTCGRHSNIKPTSQNFASPRSITLRHKTIAFDSQFWCSKRISILIPASHSISRFWGRSIKKFQRENIGLNILHDTIKAPRWLNTLYLQGVKPFMAIAQNWTRFTNYENFSFILPFISSQNWSLSKHICYSLKWLQFKMIVFFKLAA